MKLGRMIDLQIKFSRRYPSSDYSTVAERYVQLEECVGRLGHSLETARRALYLGLEPVPFHSKENIDRALTNIELGLAYLDGQEFLTGPFEMLCMRKRIRENMPEALWQYNIKYTGTTVARLGVNLHEENGEIVASIVNIQGKGREGIQKLKECLGDGRYWAVEAVHQFVESLPYDITVLRGLPSSNHPSNGKGGFDLHRASNLYDRTFRDPKIGMITIREEDDQVRYYERWRQLKLAIVPLQ